jgi:hypothetical protein
MAFDFMSFAGGFADVIVEKVKAEEAQARADESWDRRFQKQQDAIDRKTRYQKRREREEEAEELAKELSIHYKPDEVASIMAAGIPQAKYAKTYAEGLDAQGLSASTAYTMPKASVQSKYSFNIDDIRGSQQSPARAIEEMAQIKKELTAAESQPFASRFAKPTKKKQSDANTYQARLLELELQMSNAGDIDELNLLQQDWDKTFENYTKYSNIKDANGKKTAYDWASGKVEKIVNTNLKNALKFQDFVTIDPQSERQIITSGNDGNVFKLQLAAIARMRETYASDATDRSKTFTPVLDAEMKRIQFDINSLRRRREQLVPLNDKGQPTSYEPIQTGSRKASATHYPLDPAKPITKEYIEDNIGNYKNNDTVQYIDVDEKGKRVLRIAIISDSGVIF